MKLYKFILPLIIIICFSLIYAGDNEKESPKQSKKINWLKYDEGLEKAKKENKHIFIDFTTAWCGYCKKMEKEAFADSTVIGLLNNDFVAVRVDGDSKNKLDIDGYIITEKDLSRKEYAVTGYPTFWFLKSDGSKLAREVGYRPTEWVVGALNFVKDYKYDTTRTQQSQTNK